MRRLWMLGFWVACLFAFVMAILPQPPALPGAPTDKFQHIAAFAVLTVLASLAFQPSRPLTIGLTLASFGAAIELVQMIPALHREASVWDWMADIAATAVTLGIVAMIQRWRNKPVR